MKSIIVNNRRLTADEKVDKTIKTSSLIIDNYFDKKYRNFLDEYATVYTDGDTLFGDIDPNFPVSNLFLESPTKVLRMFNSLWGLAGSFVQRKYRIGFVLDKEDLEGYDTIIIKFNKLNKDFMRSLKTFGYFNIMVSDDPTILPGYTTGLPTGSLTGYSFVFDKKNYSMDTYTGPDSSFATSAIIDDENGLIMVDSSMMTEIPNRSGVYENKIYHKYITFEAFVYDIHAQYLEISDICLSNAHEVEFDNNVDLKIKNLTKVKESNQGIEFVDYYNTKKECQYLLPLLTQEEYRNLDTNWIQYSLNNSFYILPLVDDHIKLTATYNTDINEFYENFKFGGLFKLDGEISPDRKEYNNYEFKFKVREVI